MLDRIVSSIRRAFGLDNLVSNILFLVATLVAGVLVRWIAHVPLPYLIPLGMGLPQVWLTPEL